jgi:bifunctional non-homologous end joining protein LigD
VFSRHGNDYSDRVPAITDALQSLKVKSVTLDGEGVVCDPDGVTDFDLLRAALGRKGSRRAFLYAFDVLELDGRDLRDRPWEDRRKALTKLLRKASPASVCRTIWPRRTATRCSTTPALWASKASSRSAAIGRIGPGGRRIG